MRKGLRNGGAIQCRIHGGRILAILATTLAVLFLTYSVAIAPGIYWPWLQEKPEMSVQLASQHSAVSSHRKLLAHDSAAAYLVTVGFEKVRVGSSGFCGELLYATEGSRTASDGGYRTCSPQYQGCTCTSVEKHITVTTIPSFNFCVMIPAKNFSAPPLPDMSSVTPERVGDGCTKDDIVIHQGATAPLPNGIPTYTVQVLNVCAEKADTGCEVGQIHFSCGWFASARLVNPHIFRRLRYDDCLVNDGRPLPSGSSLTFQYANSFPYQLSVSTASCIST